MKTNGVEVQLYAAYAYDSVIVLADAMQKAGSSEPAKYLGYVQSANVKRITGPIAFDQRGDIKNGAVTTLPKVRLKRRFPCFDDIFYILRTRFF